MKFMEIFPDQKEKCIRVMTVEIKSRKNLLRKFYDIIGCSSVDFVDFMVGKNQYTVICDDEFLYRQPLVPTFYISDGIIICGTFLIGKTDKEGNTVGLDDTDISQLETYVRWQFPRLAKFMESMIGNVSGTGAVAEAMNIVKGIK